MNTYTEAMRSMQAFVDENLATCCEELVEWRNTSLLRKGKVQDAAAMVVVVDSAHHLSMVENYVEEAAMKAVVTLTAERDKWEKIARDKHMETLDWAGRHQVISHQLDAMLDILKRARDAIEALDGTSVENEKLVDDYRKIVGEAP